MALIALATCREWPAPVMDAPLRETLEARGHSVRSLPWNESRAEFHDADLVVIRSCWDYSRHEAEFRAWIDDLEHASVRLHNRPDMVRWNMNKRYLLELQSHGIRMPDTALIESVSNACVLEEMVSRGWGEAVVKPLVGQGGLGVVRLHPDHYDDWPDLPGAGAQALMQEFRPEISRLGETIMIFFAGRFSHAVRRVIAPGEWRSNFRYGAERIRCDASPEIVRQAREVLSVLEEPPMYARVDGLVDGDTLTVMELEAIEPDLGFVQVPQAAETFAKHMEAAIAEL